MSLTLNFGKQHYSKPVDEIPVDYAQWLITIPRYFQRDHPWAYKICRRRVIAHLLAEASTEIGPWPPSLDPSLRRLAAAATATELKAAREAVATLEALHQRLTTSTTDDCEDLA